MGQTTISWTSTFLPNGTVLPGYTFNPWIGCSKISAGCTHCYAEQYGNRFGVQWGSQGTRRRTSESNWREPLKWNRRAEKDGVRRKVFCASLADVFEGKTETLNWLGDLGQLIEKCRNLVWLLLTKRPENVMRLITDCLAGRIADLWLADNPHVWIGTTAENQQMAIERVPILLDVPAKVRFLSCEPLLGPINLRALPTLFGIGQTYDALVPNPPYGKIDWVIVGGESGKNARPMHLDWARSLRDQCKTTSTPFLFKQWGDAQGDPTKHHGGDLLDGREWREFPKA